MSRIAPTRPPAPASAPGPPRHRAHAWGLLALALFLPAVLAPPLNHDVAAVLAFTQRWLGGERLYAELIDVNPPLIFILNLLPAALAAWTPLDGVAALRLSTLAFGALCWALSLRMRDRGAEGAVERHVLDALPGFFLLGAGYDFAQREHLMAVAALPYVLCAQARAAGRQPRGRYAVAIIAAIGFALKPHFLGIPVLVEALILRQRGPRAAFTDPTPWVMAGLWLAYLLSIKLLFADYLQVVLPLVWDFYVDLGGLSIWQVLLVPRMATALLLFLPMLWLAFARSTATLPRLLAMAGLGAAAAVAAQHKGWSYHIVPLEFFACALAVLLGARWLDACPDTRADTLAGAPRRAGRLIGLAVLYLLANGDAPWKQLEYPGSEADSLAQKLAREAAGERVLVFSPAIDPIYPALNYAGSINTLRTMSMWLLQGANAHCPAEGKRYRDVWEMGRAEFFVYRTVAEDFARAPPAAVVVDTQSGIPWCGAEFQFIPYFVRHPLFAEVWSHYHLTSEWGHYRVYTRKD